MLNPHKLLGSLAPELSDSHCRACQRLHAALEALVRLPAGGEADHQTIQLQAADWLTLLPDPQHDVTDCPHCGARSALEQIGRAAPGGEAPVRPGELPAEAGGLWVCDFQAPVAVVALADPGLAQALVRLQPAGLAAAGWSASLERAGEVIRATLSGLTVRHLILVGDEPGLLQQAHWATSTGGVQVLWLPGRQELRAVTREVYALLLETLEASVCPGGA